MSLDRETPKGTERRSGAQRVGGWDLGGPLAREESPGVVMWRAVSSRRDTSDPEFVAWIIDAESDDGQFRVVKVKIDASTVDDGPWLTGDGALRQVREALETRGGPSSSRCATEPSCQSQSSIDPKRESSSRNSPFPC